MKTKHRNSSSKAQVKLDFTQSKVTEASNFKSNENIVSAKGRIIELNTNPRREIYNRIINRTME